MVLVLSKSREIVTILHKLELFEVQVDHVLPVPRRLSKAHNDLMVRTRMIS